MQMFIEILILISKVTSLSEIRIDFNRHGLDLDNFWWSTGIERLTVESCPELLLI